MTYGVKRWQLALRCAPLTEHGQAQLEMGAFSAGNSWDREGRPAMQAELQSLIRRIQGLVHPSSQLRALLPQPTRCVCVLAPTLLSWLRPMGEAAGSAQRMQETSSLPPRRLILEDERLGRQFTPVEDQHV